MRKQLTMIYALLALALGLISCGDDNDTTVAPSPEPPVSGYTTAEDLLESQNFSGSVLISKNGQDILRKGFGLADVAANVANDVTKSYRIGSMTKAFTAMAVVNLLRDGHIDSYDQPLSDFSEDLPYGEDITLKHLLTHRSGIPDYVGPIEDAVMNENLFISTEDILEIIAESIADDGLQFDPGSQFGYSNSNYLILGLLIEELTGLTYEAYLKTTIFDVLGLAQTHVGADEITGNAFAKGYANGVEVGAYPMHVAYSAGNMVSNIHDLETWGQALMGNSLLSTIEKTDVFAAPDSRDGYNTIGMGWFTVTIEGKLVHYHGGDINGFTSLMAMLPESNGLIILLSNEEDKGAQRNLLFETIIANEF